MNGNKALLDSNVIIYLSKGLIEIDKILTTYNWLYISIITYMEVLGFQFETREEKELIEELLNQFEIIHLDLEIAKKVITIRQKKRIKLPDVIIYATAEVNKLDLITYNDADFVNINRNVKIIKPEETS